MPTGAVPFFYMSAYAARMHHTELDPAPPLWPLAERPGFLARRLYQIHVALFSDACAQFDVTPVQYSLLSALSLRNSADQTTLAADVALDRTTVTGALKRLEKRGFIQRSTSEQDRRSQECRLTPAGARLLTEMEEPARRAHRQTIAPLTAAEQAILVELMGRLVAFHSSVPGQETPEST